MIGKAKNRFFNIVLVTIIFFVSLFFFEFGFRYYLHLRYDKQRAGFQDPLFKISPNSLLEFSMNPNLQIADEICRKLKISGTYTTNNDGFRGKNISHNKVNGVKRIMFLGDSYTFGWGVNDNEIYPERIQLILGVNSDVKIEVINLGVPGYNTIQENEVLRNNINLFNPDLVVLAYVMNDAELQVSVPRSPEVTYRFAYSWAYESFKDLLNARFLKICHFKGAQQQTTDYLLGFKPGNPKWKESREAIKRMASLCKKRGVIFVVTILPDFTQRFDSSYRYAYIHDSVTKLCHEFKIDTIDLLPNFLGTDHLKLWVPEDGHPNATAHQKIAEILSVYLRGILKRMM